MGFDFFRRGDGQTNVRRKHPGQEVGLRLRNPLRKQHHSSRSLMSDMTTHLDGDVLPLGESETKDGVDGAEFIGLKREERHLRMIQV